jgi:glycosyltransferase involved in cell wall biosynthesis
MKKNILIVPCYNEEAVLETTYSRLKSLYDDLISQNKISKDSKICFVDDGSLDKTWEIISKLCKSDEYVQGIKFSRNFGHQAALISGLESKYGLFDTYITIDADLQDDISVIGSMISETENGSSIVYGVINDRSNDSFFKRVTAKFFYKTMKALGANTLYNHADFRLIDNRALSELLRFQERNLFLRGIFPMLGYKYSIIQYKRAKREQGETKYPLRKMISFAWEGISSLSSKPLRLILYLGLSTFAFSMGILIWATFVVIKGWQIPGWFSIIFPTTFFGGVQMISIGIIGEYIGKIYTEIKARPRYIIEKNID